MAIRINKHKLQAKKVTEVKEGKKKKTKKTEVIGVTTRAPKVLQAREMGKATWRSIKNRLSNMSKSMK